MKVLYVRGLSDAVREVLEREAEQAHRSLSAQIVTILEMYIARKRFFARLDAEEDGFEEVGTNVPQR